MKNPTPDQQKIWNESSKTIPLDKDPSAYAIEKEKLFPKSSVVCDLGGGTGVDSIYFLQKGHSVILMDISDYGLEVARNNAERLGFINKLTLIQTDLSKGELPIGSNSCDVVYSRLSLHYFYPEELTNIFREINRILKVDGVAYITIKSPKDEREMSFLRKTAKELEPDVFDNNGQVKARYSAPKLKEMMGAAGIEKFEIRDYMESFLGRTDRVKSGSDKLILLEIIVTK